MEKLLKYLTVMKSTGVMINATINSRSQMRAVKGNKSAQPVSQTPSLAICSMSFKQLQLWKVKSCQKKTQFAHETSSKPLILKYAHTEHMLIT